MKPIVFGDRFGWLHTGSSARGVILCNTYGHEYVWTYNGMRYLADELSARGIWVLRFDYAGTGNSAGADGKPDQFESAVSDIHAAIDVLKAETGVEHVSLCGFRVGAAFALCAAMQKPVDDLVLLEPVTSGRIYLRELSMVRKTWLEQLAPPLRAAQQDSPFRVLGQVYSDEFKRSLESVDLPSTLSKAKDAPARRALLMQARTGANEPLRDALAALGVQAETRPFEGLAGFIQETAFSILPEESYADAVEWMSAGRERAVPSRMEKHWPDDLCIQTPEAIERPVCIGEAGLFGILCEPRTGTTHGLAYLLANTSASAHVGDSRLSVRIARELARGGIASLRFDAHGRGDSPPDITAKQPIGRFSHIYDSVATEDTAAAARWLTRHAYKTIFSFGICSGAYHALRAGIIETTIKGVVAVNIPTFNKPEEKAPGAPREAAHNSMAGYAISMLDPAKWKTVLSDEKKLTQIVHFVVGNLAARARSLVVSALRLDALSNTPRGQETQPLPMMRALDAKGVKTVLVHGAYDASMDLLAANFGRRGARLSRFPSIRVAIFDDIDHALFNATNSAKVISLCDSVIKETSGAAEQTNHPVGAPAVS
ncbi:alpha/beta hydrolase [Paraburkholderia sp. HP33-1]|uniref:alpha/beta hydrolase n=1 Tax=Paraburkholderia sp. HP33-1 TaxID=2883243 RepID=UPI001F46E7F7|nr:alpha/beta fold hydrolase [Paraburkholderia sp. HP33-1]